MYISLPAFKNLLAIAFSISILLQWPVVCMEHASPTTLKVENEKYKSNQKWKPLVFKVKVTPFELCLLNHWETAFAIKQNVFTFYCCFAVVRVCRQASVFHANYRQLHQSASDQGNCLFCKILFGITSYIFPQNHWLCCLRYGGQLSSNVWMVLYENPLQLALFSSYSLGHCEQECPKEWNLSLFKELHKSEVGSVSV